MIWDEWIGTPDGRPTMWVKHLFCRWGCHIDLHKFVARDDEACFHTHPAYAVRVILWGGYREEREDRTWKLWLPGMFGLIRPTLSHRIGELMGRRSYSLWIRFRKVAEIRLRGDGWNTQPAQATICLYCQKPLLPGQLVAEDIQGRFIHAGFQEDGSFCETGGVASGYWDGTKKVPLSLSEGTRS